MFQVNFMILSYLEYDPIDHCIESILMVEENDVHHYKPDLFFLLKTKIILQPQLTLHRELVPR